MTTTPNDELAMPHFEEQLWAEIRAHHEDGTWTRPAAVAARDRVPATVAGRPAIHRRAARRSLAAAAALAVIAAAGALSATSGGDSDGTGDIETRTIAALDEVLDDSIVYTVGQIDGVAVHEGWYDKTSRFLSRDPDGTPVSDWGPGVAPEPDGDPSADEVNRQVDYCASEYTDRTDLRVVVISENEAETMRDNLADGSLVADGTEVVDGQELIRLAAAAPTPPLTEVVYYVDPTTYRPVLVRISSDGEATPTIASQTVTFEYLPRTAENLSQLVPPIPEGFTRTASPDDLPFPRTSCD